MRFAVDNEYSHFQLKIVTSILIVNFLIFYKFYVLVHIYCFFLFFYLISLPINFV